MISWAAANETCTKMFSKAVKMCTKNWLSVKNDSTIPEGWSREGNKMATIST